MNQKALSLIGRGLLHVSVISVLRLPISSARQLTTQFQNVQPNDLNQFRDGSKQPILWPPEFKSGEMIYPYADARKK